MDSLIGLYCLIGDFCRVFDPAWERHLLAMGGAVESIGVDDARHILFHQLQLRFRQFKRFYLGYVCRRLRAAFPKLPSYQRCVELRTAGGFIR
jgi:hypothetical protein